MNKKTYRIKSLLLVAAFLVIAAAASAYFINSNNTGQEAKDVQPFQVNTEGYSVADVSIDQSTLYLSTDCYQISMDISDTQALSIDRGLEKIIDNRPLTHDTMKDMMDNFGISALAARIESFEDGIYYARVILRQGNRVLSLDSRPSDAVAIAVRTGISVYVKDDVISRYGKNTCEPE